MDELLGNVKWKWLLVLDIVAAAARHRICSPQVEFAWIFGPLDQVFYRTVFSSTHFEYFFDGKQCVLVGFLHQLKFWLIERSLYAVAVQHDQFVSNQFRGYLPVDDEQLSRPSALLVTFCKRQSLHHYAYGIADTKEKFFAALFSISFFLVFAAA